MPKVINDEENKKACSCPNCPSYNDCAKEKSENLYCAIGKSPCQFPTNGCICGMCKVHEKFKLKSYYYCKKGSAEKIG